MLEKHNIPELTVSQLSSSIQNTIEESFSYVRIRGEISGAKFAPSGHLYLNLKDDKAILAAVCWKGNNIRLPFAIEDGIEVICTGKVTTYPGQSRYQLVIDSMEPAGVGALMALLEKRKKELAAEGLFDASRKKPLPYMPEVIGIVTSPTGAVIKDILHRLEDRFPVKVLLWPVLVQGDKAAAEISEAIDGFNKFNESTKYPRPDVIIVARGGGSIEDLWPFNEEIVVRSTANSDIPIISAVGHETDTTLIDYASDRRAPTPTAAAEMAVPVRLELLALTDDMGARIKKSMLRLFDNKKEKIHNLSRMLPRPAQILDEKTQSLDILDSRLTRSLSHLTDIKEHKLASIFSRLKNPEQIMDKKIQQFNNLQSNLSRSFNHLIDIKEHKMTNLFSKLQKPSKQIEISQMLTENLFKRLTTQTNNLIDKKFSILNLNTKLLNSYHYKKILERGFAIVHSKNDGIIKSASDISTGQILQIEFHDGKKTVISEGKKAKNIINAEEQTSLF